jgi:hypothetical protein
MRPEDEQRVRPVGGFVFDYALAEKKWLLVFLKTGWRQP